MLKTAAADIAIRFRLCYRLDMNKFFSNDSLFGIFFGHLGDIVIVNFLFLLTSIPLVTVGPSLCGMNYAFLKRRRKSDEPIARLYFEGFRSNFKQGLLAWLLLLGILLILLVDRYAFSSGSYFSSPVLHLFVSVLLAVVFFTALWLFAVIPSFTGSLRVLILHSFRFAVLHLPTTLLFALPPFFISFILLSDFVTFAFVLSLLLLFGFGLIGWTYSFFLIRVFLP